MKGSVYKRCRCPVRRNDKGEALACKKPHGSWYYRLDAGSTKSGSRRQPAKGGFRTKTEAEEALAAAITEVHGGTFAADGAMTVEKWLTSWLDSKRRAGRATTTLEGYRRHVEDLLIPHLGRLRMKELRVEHVEKVLAWYADLPTRGGGVRSAADVQRLRATLRSALNTARKRKVVGFNAAADVDLASGAAKKCRPWEAADLGAFLDHAVGDPLGALYEVIAALALRRGEGCGMRWADVDFTNRRFRVWQQLVQITEKGVSTPPCGVCRAVHKGRVLVHPKTDAVESAPWYELDSHTIGILLAHKLRQDEERSQWRGAYADHDLVFAQPNGDPLRPDAVTVRFKKLTSEVRFPEDAHLPDEDRRRLRQVRVHDLRHGAASLRIATGSDLVVVSKIMRHKNTRITGDLYTHLLEGVGREAAERANASVPRNRRAQSVHNIEAAAADLGAGDGVAAGEVGLDESWRGDLNPQPFDYKDGAGDGAQ